MFDKKVFAIHCLRVNVKSLAAEAKIIRRETKRAGSVYRERLVDHRRGKLRAESRATQLALAFLRETPYRSVENTKKPVPTGRIRDKLLYYGIQVSEGRLCSWLNFVPA